jgi:hypothetical protein
MSDQRLRDLLEEQVADVPAIDVVEKAWRGAGEVRRRRRAVVAVAVAVLAVVGTTAVVVADGRDGAAPPVERPTVSPSGTASTRAPRHDPTDLPGGDLAVKEPGPNGADAELARVPIWFGPDQEQEASLPWLADSPLPRRLDVAEEAASAPEQPIERAVAAVGYPSAQDPDWVVLLGADGTIVKLDVSRLQPFRDINSAHDLTTRVMLSPDGRHLVFPQDGHVDVVDVSTGEWTTIETGDDPPYVSWVDNTHLWLHAEGKETGPLYTIGGERVTGDSGMSATALFPADQDTIPDSPSKLSPDQAEADVFAGAGLPVPGEGDLKYISGPAYLTVVGPSAAALVLPVTNNGTPRDQWSPTAAGWLDDRTVVYESSVAGRHDLLIAWKVGTHEFHRVMQIVPDNLGGFYGGPSFADLSAR